MYYVYTSRFQPLNLLNVEELKWLAHNIEEQDRIIIGIVNPNPQLADPGDNADSWTRFKRNYNPLNYWERYSLINEYLLGDELLKNKIIMICPLPRPSVNMLSASNYLPPHDERMMCLQVSQDNDQEDQKHSGLERQGERIFEIPSFEFDASLTMISPELICCLVALGSENWIDFVPESNKNSLKRMGFIDRVRLVFPSRDAKRILRRIYNRECTSSEQQILYPICKRHISGIEEIIVSRSNDSESCLELQDKMKRFEDELNEWCYNHEADSPELYRKFSGKTKILSSTIQNFKNGTITENDAAKIYTAIHEEWLRRK